MFDLLVEEKSLEGIPYIHIRGKEEPHSLLFYYHGWDSSAQSSIFRGKIFASFGFDTYLPDAYLHGKRQVEGVRTDGDLDWARLFQVIEQSRREFAKFYEKRTTDDIYLAGHSMGAMTAGAILASYPAKGGLILNGALDFKNFARFYGAHPDWEKIVQPMDYLDMLADKILYLGNGREDTTVLPPYQESFYHQLKEKDPTACFFQLFEGTGHVVTSNMLDEGLNFLFTKDPHLKEVKKAMESSAKDQKEGLK